MIFVSILAAGNCQQSMDLQGNALLLVTRGMDGQEVAIGQDPAQGSIEENVRVIGVIGKIKVQGNLTRKSWKKLPGV